MWSTIASKTPNIPNVEETPQQKFARVYLRYVHTKNVQGETVKILWLNHAARKDDPDVLKNHEFMLDALKFDLQSSIQVVDQSLFTIDFICDAYAIPNVRLQIFQCLPHYVRCNPKLMIGIYKRLDLTEVLKSIPSNLCGDPAFMCELVLEDPTVYRIARGRAKYSFTVLLATILNGTKINAVKIYEESRHKEPYLQIMLKFFSENPTIYTMDNALLTCISESRELTLKHQFDPEYCSFFDRVRHDISYYNQICAFQLCVYSSIKHCSGILCKLKQGMFTKILMDKICDYVDTFSYGEDVTMVTILKIAKHLRTRILIHY
jgi:hypothetical protein